MESRAKLLGHPVHQMMVTFPIGALGFSVVSDALHSCLGQRKFAEAANLALDFGLVSAAVAAPFGAVDWLAIPAGTRAKRVGLWHAVGNIGMLGLFGASRWLRRDDPTSTTAKWLSGGAFMLSGVTAWLGGELVNRHGIGVSDQLGVNAPSSLDSADDLSDAPTLPGFHVARTYRQPTSPR